ncbi:MAG TPA: hypothetical protein VMM37_08445 [Bacteroidota bacterium]|nr:hypothetical protein [Bacteroidota bacterium]
MRILNRQSACVTVLLCVTLAGVVESQVYRKKVVSYVDMVLVPPQFPLTQYQRALIRKSVPEAMTLTRFNYAPLPEHVVAAFASASSTLATFTPENVRPIIEQTLAPPLVSILDINKELYSKQNLSETERNTFLATKAKAAGLSASELESILNSGYFYVPFVEKYVHTVKKDVREEKDQKGKVVKKVPYTKYSHELALGLLWYKVNVDEANNASVVYVGRVQGWKGFPVERSKEQDDDENGDADGSAFRDVVDVNCKNIALETKRMETFSLAGGVTEVSATGLRLSLGSREGVGLDDTFWIEEMEETDAGQIIKTKRGFVKVRQVGDNKRNESATSYAQVITGTNYSAGLSATELPLMGMNAIVSATVFPARISPFNTGAPVPAFLTVPDSQYNFGFHVLSESRLAYGGMFGVQISLAHTANVSELWFHIGGTIGVTNVDGKFYVPHFDANKNIAGTDSADIGASLTGNITAGLVKKFYFRRYGFLLQADVKYSLLRMSASGKDETNKNDVSYKLTNGALGFDARAGLEIYMTPTLSVGFAAAYDLYGVTNSYTALVTDNNNNDITKKTDVPGPDLRYGGLGYYVWVNYSLPSFF